MPRIPPILLALLIAVGVALPAAAQELSFQGTLTDENQPPVNASVEVIFSLFAAETGGDAVWIETQTVAVADGAEP